MLTGTQTSNMKQDNKIPISFNEYTGYLITGLYDNGRTALQIKTWDNETIATCTINLPDEVLNSNEVIIKDYSENEGMYDTLLKAGIIAPEKRRVASGYITAPVCDLLVTANK